MADYKMADSKTVESEVADFSGSEIRKPDVQLDKPAWKPTGKAEQFIDGRLSDMNDAYHNLIHYTYGHRDDDIVPADKLHADLTSFLRFANLYEDWEVCTEYCIANIKFITKTFDDFNNLEKLAAGDGLDTPKSVHKRIMDVFNESIAEINKAYIPDYEPSTKLQTEEALINSFASDLAESGKLAHTIILARNIINYIEQLRDKYHHTYTESDGVRNIVHPPYLVQNIKELAEFCKGKTRITYRYKVNFNKIFHDMKDVSDSAGANTATAPKAQESKSLWEKYWDSRPPSASLLVYFFGRSK